MSRPTQTPDSRPAPASEAQETAISTLLSLQGIAANPTELRSASRAWQRLNPLGAARPPAKASS